MEGGTVMTTLVAVWTAVVDFVVGLFGDVTALFYVAGTGLTFIGTLAAIAVGVGFLYLVIRTISSFIRRAR